MNGILAYLTLSCLAKILGILACSDYYVPLGWYTLLRLKKKEKILPCTFRGFSI